MVAHPHGVTFARRWVRASPSSGRRGRRRGGAKRQQCAHRLARLCRGALPDRLPENVITLDTESMADDTDVDQQGQTVIPGGGAVVMANYQTHIGNRVLFTLRNARAATVWRQCAAGRGGGERQSAGRHGGRRRPYLSGVPQEGTPAVSWIVNNQSQSCTLHFHLPDNPQQSLNTVKTVSGLCQTR